MNSAAVGKLPRGGAVAKDKRLGMEDAVLGAMLSKAERPQTLEMYEQPVSIPPLKGLYHEGAL
jgi:hypothetical protein